MNAVRASSRQQWLVSRSRWLPAGGHVGQCRVVEGHGRSGHGTSSASAGGLAGSCGQLYLGVCGRRGEGGWIWAAGSIGVRQGRGGCLSMGVVRRHSREKSGSVLLCLALSMVFLTVWTMRSANPLDWGYLGELVMCLNPQSAANVLNSRQSYCGPLSDSSLCGMPCSPNSCFRTEMTVALVELEVRRRTKGIFE